MKKRFISVIVLLIAFITGSSHAAGYTLPEKMNNQLSIGSGLKGSFSVDAEGEKYSTPFLDAVTDAEWAVRGIRSGDDLHYYVFQTNDRDEQTALSEIYRKEGIYYLRSDMVQGQILAFPVLSQILSSLFPESGENGSASSFIANIINLPENVRKDKWEPVLQKYQNQLELWLAEFTVTADTVKMENGLSALDFSYEIPMENIYEQSVKLIGDFTKDPEATALLDTVMTDEEKKTYLNGNLLYFYLDALHSLQIDQPVRMSKRVSAIGDVLRFRLELPLDERTTGYQSLDIENVDQLTIITIRKTGQIMVAAFPAAEKLKQQAFDQSIWFARLNADPEKEKENTAVRIDIVKTNETYEKDEKTHEINHYEIKVLQDTKYLPADSDLSVLPDYTETDISVDLHYSSKYAQNSATTLEIGTDIKQGDSTMNIRGKFKTAAPWLFMPFEIIDPIPVGTEKETVLDPYITDWISNAASMIHHNESEPETEAEVSETVPDNEGTNETAETETETAPMDIPEQE